MTDEAQGSRIAPEEFRSIMGHFASGVTIITADEDGEPLGTTASAFSSLSLEPPMVVVCLNKESNTGQVVARTGRLGVNILGEESPDVAMRFARKGRDDFAGLAWHRGGDGVPVLDDALASIECHVVEQTEGGTHIVFIAAADAATLRVGAPLAYFKGRFGRIETEGDLHAVRLIQQRILEQQPEVGTELDVDRLAAELGLPRGETYHALGTLRDQALVYRDNDGRFRVATLSARMVVEALEARTMIELGVVHRTVGRLDSEQLTGLRSAAEATGAADRVGTSEAEWATANQDFHERLIALAGNGSLANVYRQFNVTAILGRIQETVDGADRRDLSGASEHLALVEALERGDEQAATEAILAHQAESVSSAEALLSGRNPVAH